MIEASKNMSNEKVSLFNWATV